MSSSRRYFEDFKPGMAFRSKDRVVVREDIRRFADLTGDHNSLHTDENFAKSMGFKNGVIAHGLLTLSLALGLWDSLGMTGDTVLAFAGINGVSFKAPVFPGDSVHLEAEVLSVRESKSRPATGLVTFRMKIAKSSGPVLEAEPVLIFRKREHLVG